MDNLERIAKVIARRTGIARRKAEVLIAENRVKIDDKLITHPSEKVGFGANITIDDQQIAKFKAPEIWLFNKPPQFETTRGESEKPSVYDLLPEKLQDLKYIGRLDYMSEGLLLLTNDGELIDYFSRAKNKVEKVYRVRCYSLLDPEEFIEILSTPTIIDGEKYTIDRVRIRSHKNGQYELELTLTEGKNREIRNILKHYQVRVSKLIRVQFGPYSLGKLRPGHYCQVKVEHAPVPAPKRYNARRTIS